MKKLIFVLPAFLLFACGGSETENEVTEEDVNEAVDNALDNLEEELNQEVNEVEAPEVFYQPDNHAEAEIVAYLDEKGWEGEKHESGMYIVTEELGEGDDRPTLLDEVTIYYSGYLLDGTQFDGTQEGTPATFPLMNLIQGWQIGIPMFGKGGKGKLIIPSGLAYGDSQVGDIPAGSTLMFEIELIDWAPAM